MTSRVAPLEALGPLEMLIGSKTVVRKDISLLEEGVHVFDDVFVNLDKNGNVIWVVSRECDHNGGKLLPTRNCMKARCPNHGWELNLSTLSYTNVRVQKKKCEWSFENGELCYEVAPRHLVMPGRQNGKASVKMRFLAHACVAFDIGDFRLITDPWLVGPCFTTGWWHAYPPKEDAIQVIRQASMVYISHNHPDHLHPETLSYLSKDVPIITPNFATQSSERMLKDLGFTDVRSLPMNMAFSVEDIPLHLSLLPSGDFRDDSGIFLTSQDFSALLTVDSNNLNSGVLPEGVDLLMTSFAGGASGYPLCFENKSIEQRRKLTQSFRKSILDSVLRTIGLVKPKYYIPYAGFFRESAERDRAIAHDNVKNTPQGIFEEVAKLPYAVHCINPVEYDKLTFAGDEVVKNQSTIPRLYEINDHYLESYIGGIKELYKAEPNRSIFDYFEGSDFQNALVLLLQPTNDEFLPEGNGFEIDFRSQKPVVQERSPEYINEKYASWNEESGGNVLLMKVRRDSLFFVIKNRLPWEDLSIGFQCRFLRKPDVYNNEFWHYFNNIYISQKIVPEAV